MQVILCYPRKALTPDRPYVQVIQFDVRSEQLRKQISRELRTLHGSRHPNIVRYHQSFLQDGGITIAMEYMDRDTLAHLLKRLPALWSPISPASRARCDFSLESKV